MRAVLVSLAVGLLIYVLLAYMYFALREPDRLQSEEFRIDSRRIELLGQQGSDHPVLDLQAEQVRNSYLPEATEEKAHANYLELPPSLSIENVDRSALPPAFSKAHREASHRHPAEALAETVRRDRVLQ